MIGDTVATLLSYVVCSRLTGWKRIDAANLEYDEEV
jgi:hypothetical protein